MIIQTKPSNNRKFAINRYLHLRGILIVCLVIACFIILLGVSACAAPPTDVGSSTSAAEAAEQSQDQSPAEQQVDTTLPVETENEDLAEDNQAPVAEDTAPASPEMIQEMWSGSTHADTFILDEAGNNNACARCHSPVVWLPSLDDMPETCFACKFEVSDPPPLIAESDWVQIECIVCHEVDKKGNVNPEYAWLEIAQIEEYAEVASPTELCQKCHTESETPGHTFAHLGGAHTGYECTDCHDAHDTIASCSSSGCHEDVVNPETAIPGHDQDHVQVSCAACHDADTMTIDIEEESGIWTTFAPDPVGGEALIQYASHNTVLEAPCERCHFANNPWDLTNEIE